MLACNVNICAHNKNGEYTRKNVIINLNVYDGLIPYCSNFDTSLEYVRQQYGFHKYDDETIVIVLKDCTAEILRDMAKIKKLSKKILMKPSNICTLTVRFALAEMQNTEFMDINMLILIMD